MPYKQHSSVVTPPDETIIWRYMDLPKLLSLLQERALYFALFRELPDAWEGAVPGSLVGFMAQAVPAGASGDILNSLRAFPSLAGINCWYRGISESIAMWSLYTQRPYGTAIKTTVERLKNAVANAPQTVNIGIVKYDVHEPHPGASVSNDMNALRPLLCKRRCYEHECEVRALTISLEPARARGERLTLPSSGTLVAVDLSVLIKEIVLGPDFPVWAEALIVGAIKRAGLALDFSRSNVYSIPPSVASDGGQWQSVGRFREGIAP